MTYVPATKRAFKVVQGTKLLITFRARIVFKNRLVKKLPRKSIHCLWIHSDEGLTLETSVFESFTVADLPYRPCG